MAPSKLSNADKQDIIECYKQPGETTSTLADRYGVSNSTISRLLKSSLPEAEYSALIQQKRSSSEPTVTTQTATQTTIQTGPERTKSKSSSTRGRKRAKGADTPIKTTQQTQSATASDADLGVVSPEAGATAAPTQIATPTRRRRSRAAESSESTPPALPNQEPEDEGDHTAARDSGTSVEKPILKRRSASKAAAVPDSTGPDSTGPDPTVTDEELEESELDASVLSDQDDDWDSDDDWDEDDETDDDDGSDDDDGAFPEEAADEALVQIMPLTQDVLPKPCYLVIDRMAELITRPLKSFGELGPLPAAENTAKTLPVFNNHRVARRFIRGNQRVIKVPDGRLLQKTSAYLQAKGITHLLISGHVYSLL